MKTASAKKKGARLQQEVRDKILDTYPDLEPDDVRSTSMGVSGEDVQLSPAARKKFNYGIECKSRATIMVYAWYQQAKRNTSVTSEPLLVIKQNHSKPLVVMDMEHFFSLMEKLK